MVLEKLPHALARIDRRLAVVFHPMAKHGRTGLEVRVIETMVGAGIGDLLDGRSLATPSDDLARAVFGGRPIVGGTNQKRGYLRAQRYQLARRIECNHYPKAQIAWQHER